MFFHPISSKDSVSVVIVYLHHSIEVALNDEFATGKGCLNNLLQVLAEICHVYIWTHESWYIDADNGDIPGLTERKAELHDAFIYSRVQMFFSKAKSSL